MATHTDVELNELLRGVEGDERGLLAFEGDVEAALAGRAQAVDQLNLLRAARGANHERVVALGAEALLAGDTSPALFAHAAVDLVRVESSVVRVVQVSAECLKIGDVSQRDASTVSAAHCGDVRAFGYR